MQATISRGDLKGHSSFIIAHQPVASLLRSRPDTIIYRNMGGLGMAPPTAPMKTREENTPRVATTPPVKARVRHALARVMAPIVALQATILGLLMLHQERFKKDTGANMGIGQNILTVVAIVIGLALTPVVNDSVTESQNGSSGATSSLLGLIPMVYVVIVLGIGVSVLVKQFRN